MKFSYVLALLLTAALASACASAAAKPPERSPALDAHLLSEYAQRVPPGARVIVDRTTGGSVRGIVLTATADSIVVQNDTGAARAPETVALKDVSRILVVAPRDHTTALTMWAGVGVAFSSLFVFGMLAALA